MVSPGRLPLSLLTIVLLLVPGVLALEYFARKAGKRFEISRIERIVYSVLFSLGSLGVLYALSPVYFAVVTEWVGSNAARLGFVSVVDLEGLGLAEVAMLYFAQIAIALGVARGAGYLSSEHINSDRELDPRPPWQYAFDETEEETIEIGLNDGKVIRGSFNEAAWEATGQDLYIEDPQEIHYEDGEERKEPTDIGRSILLTKSAIAYVSFVTEDPDAGASMGDPQTVERLLREQQELINEALSGAGAQSTLDEYDDGEDGP